MGKGKPKNGIVIPNQDYGFGFVDIQQQLKEQAIVDRRANEFRKRHYKLNPKR